MKKLISVLVVVMVCALAFTVVATASDAIYEPDAEGLYSFDYDLSAVESAAVADGTMYGMVVIEAQEGVAFALTEDNIRYIDQVNAANNSLKFADFAPMDATGTDTKYLVYIGGGNLGAATRIATLSLEPLEYYDIVFMNGSDEVKKVTKVVGETLKVADFPTVPEKKGYTGKWDVTTDITGETTDTITVNAVYEAIAPTAVTLNKETASVAVDKTVTLTATVEPADALYELEWSSSAESIATVEDGVVTAVAEGEATITATIVGTQIKAECVITVTAAPQFKLGDVDHSDSLNTLDAYAIIRTVVGYTVENYDAELSNVEGADSAEDVTTLSAYSIVRKVVGYNVPALDAVWGDELE